MMKSAGIFLIIFSFLISSGYGETNTTAVVTNTSGTNSGEVILVTLSRACHCTLEQCRNVKLDIKKILEDKNFQKIKFTEIDYSVNKKTADELLKKYQFDYLPCVTVIDTAGTVFYKGSFNIEEDKIRQALNKIIEKRKEKEEEKKK